MLSNAAKGDAAKEKQADAALNFEQIHAFERAHIRAISVAKHPETNPQTGLAFSGGGIRSATFNLGILQALAQLKLLRGFDYLSCVSGGGYIGGWLSAFIHSDCEGKVEKAEEKLSNLGGANIHHQGASNEDAAIKFLRSYSNYLTPKASFFSADTLAAIATFVRNLYLNLSMLLLFLGSLLLLPRLLVGLLDWASKLSNVPLTAQLQFSPIFLVANICTLITLLFVGINLGFQGASKSPPFYTRQGGILCLIVLPSVLSAWLMSYTLFKNPQDVGNFLWVCGPFLYAAVWVGGWWWGSKLSQHASRLPNFDPKYWIKIIIFAVIATVFGGALIAVFAQFAQGVKQQLAPNDYLGLWLMTALGTLLMLKFYSLIVVAHIGLMGRDFSHESREWLSRIGGWVLLLALAWAFIFTVVCVAPSFFHWAPNLFLNTGGLAWVGATAWGVLSGRSASTGATTKPKWRDFLAVITPYIFIVGLLGLLSFGLYELLLMWSGVDDCTHARADSFTKILACDVSNFQKIPIKFILTICLGSMALAAILAFRIDINLFSIYHFYRQRLTRCYLGASRGKQRTADVFTGFDGHDDLHLDALRDPQDATKYQRPYPIHNTAMNMVSGKQLAWQQRRAAAFAFTPAHCGYSFTLPDEQGQRVSYYRPSSQYMGNVWIGSAVAISGAAASPNMGFHSSPALTFLMTIFNVRLGHWSGNPSNEATWRCQGPSFAGFYLLKELFGLTDYNSSYVYLSDGGHFENLGIYELVRRRCATIVAIDAAQDEQSAYADLGNAIRKCYADFGVVIDIHTDALKASYSATGRIHYSDGTEGKLIYIKPKLIGSEPADLQNYALTHAGFPHQSTGDQWFDESQFESYRKLGHCIGLAVFEAGVLDTHHSA
jgi:hypothetical protein